jgi:hypothetical protein
MREIKSYVISVPSLYTRLEQSFWPSFSKIHSVEPELYIGIEGKNYQLPEWWTGRNKGGCIYEHTYEPAVWGLVQTYLNLFDKIIHEKVEGPILILEDDSVIIDPSTFDLDLNLFIDNLPSDWSVGYVSGYHGKNRQEKINDHVMKVSSVMQTNAVIYNGYVACELLKSYIEQETTREPIDVLYLLAYRSLNIPLYRSIKKLIYQASYQCSTIEKEYKPKEILNWQI